MSVGKLIAPKRLFTTFMRIMADNFSSMRINYKLGLTLNVEDLQVKEPFSIFEEWFSVARKMDNIKEPNAMTLATATRNGIPSARVVLLKGFDKNGFKFFTNFESQKGRDLEENPHAALAFFWPPLERQIRIQGSVEKLTNQESTEYFHSRPRGSQIGASVSRQSSVIPSTQVLIDKEKELTETLSEHEQVPKPDYWGGYRVIPNSIEFWQGRSNRLHERTLFRRKEELLVNETSDALVNWNEGNEGWMYAILSP